MIYTNFMKIGAKIVQRITGNSVHDVAHSSGIGAMGGSGHGQSFSERQQIEQNRKLVQGYHNSQIITRGKNAFSRENSYGRTAGTAADGSLDSRTSYGRVSGERQRGGYGRTASADLRQSYGRTSAAEMEQAHREMHQGMIGATSVDGTTALMRMNAPQNQPQVPSYRQNIRPDFGMKKPL